MRFINGLRDDIRSVILVQRPCDLDTACTLALLQEEAGDHGRRKEFKKPDSSIFSKSTTIKGALPLPPPPPRPPAPPPSDDKHQMLSGKSTSTDDKLLALRAYRKARGLCFRCAEKWSFGHKCPPSIQLHVLQEVFDLCQDECLESLESAPTHQPSEQLFMVLSAAAVSPQDYPRTLQLHGSIGWLSVVILVDSGSSHSFLDSSVARLLPGVSQLPTSVQVQVADGSKLQCTQEIQSAECSVQGYSFHSTLKVVPLGSYDMIIGMDWLEAFSPMKIHWKQKWISLPYGRDSIVLHGAVPVLPECSVAQLVQVQLAESSSTSDIHPDVQPLLDQYAQLFGEPTDLPPRRHCDHHIPLITGATPVSVRPYRYAPVLKSEIEKQVSEMLRSGLIQPSSSAFSSLVLLVRNVALLC